MVDYVNRVRILEKVYETQKALSESLGVSSRMLRYYKSGESQPSQEIRDKINRRWSYYKDKKGIYIQSKATYERPDGSEFEVFRRSSLSELDTDLEEKIKEELEQEIRKSGGYIAHTDDPIEGENLVDIEHEIKVVDLHEF